MEPQGQPKRNRLPCSLIYMSEWLLRPFKKNFIYKTTKKSLNHFKGILFFNSFLPFEFVQKWVIKGDNFLLKSEIMFPDFDFPLFFDLRNNCCFCDGFFPLINARIEQSRKCSDRRRREIET